MIGGNGVHGPVTDIQIVTEQMQKTKHRLTHIKEDYHSFGNGRRL